jgi:hypothetical protein
MMRLKLISTRLARTMRLQYRLTPSGHSRIQFVAPNGSTYEVCSPEKATHVRHHLTAGLSHTYLRVIRESRTSPKKVSVATRRGRAARTARRIVHRPKGKPGA